MVTLREQTLATHVPLALHATVYDHYEQHQIKVKFRDLSRVRLRDGQPVDIDNAVGAASISTAGLAVSQRPRTTFCWLPPLR